MARLLRTVAFKLTLHGVIVLARPHLASIWALIGEVYHFLGTIFHFCRFVVKCSIATVVHAVMALDPIHGTRATLLTLNAMIGDTMTALAMMIGHVMMSAVRKTGRGTTIGATTTAGMTGAMTATATVTAIAIAIAIAITTIVRAIGITEIAGALMTAVIGAKLMM